MSTPCRSSFAAATLVLAFASTAAAVQNVTTCNTTCTTDCQLTASLNCCTVGSDPACDGNGPIVLANGADFNLNGYSITCGATAGATCAYDAVTMSSSSSVVKNTSTTESKISGLFDGGVDCESHTSSRVTGIRFEGLATKGNDENYVIANCAEVDKNALFGNHDGTTPGGAAIFTYGIANSDRIHDNYIENFFTGIETNTDLGIEVDHNIVLMTGPTTAVGVDASYGTSTTEDVNHNVIRSKMDGGSPVLGSGYSTHFSQNHCDRANITTCLSCISNGWCSPFKAPFAGLS